MIYRHFIRPPQKKNLRRFHFVMPPDEAAFLFGRRRGDPVTTAIVLGVGGMGLGAASLMSGNKSKPAQAPAPITPTDTGAAKSLESVETQAAQRRLARMSKYFTSPSGVLDSGTGTTGVF